MAARCWHDRRVVDGRVRAPAWDGLNWRGRPSLAGYFRFRFETADRVGNTAATVGGRVYLARPAACR